MNEFEDGIIRLTRRELFDRVWSKPMTTNAVELRTTTSTLSSLARRLGLPLPRAGHWMKKEAGKEQSTPEYPVDQVLDGRLHPIGPSQPRRVFSPKRTDHEVVTKPVLAPTREKVEPASEPVGIPPQRVENAVPGEHRKVARTRSALRKKSSSDRAAVGGLGKFRLLVTPASADRACGILDRLVGAAGARSWPLEDTDRGYAIAADGEAIGFMIEEKLDRAPHIVTPAELKEKAEYERKCALAARGIGHRPWRAPEIPEHDYVPNGQLVLKFDHDYDAGGLRRTYSDGKRQRLENLIPAMIDTLEQWAVALKAKREERARWQREWDERDRRRKDRERQARVEGYRIAFLQRQVGRKREIDGLADLIATWEQADSADPQFTELLEFARLYRKCLEAKIAPDAVAVRIAELKLMDDDVYIYDTKSIG